MKTITCVCVTGVSLVLAVPLLAANSVTITQLVVNDSGNAVGDVTLSPAAYIAGNTINGSTLDTTGDLNLVSFIGDGTNYSASAFISGVGTSTVINSSTLDAVIQPNAHLASGATPTFYTGSASNVASYLTAGERGLSFSTGLNFKGADDPAVLSIPMTFTADPTIAVAPTFMIGDSADAQSADSWKFYAADGTTLIASFIVDDSFFTTFGDQGVDRVKTDLSGFVGANNGAGDSLGLALAAFHMENADFEPGHDWTEIAELRISVPDSGPSPKTDYAFIGIDTGTVSSTLQVVAVPEPSQTSLFALGSLAFLLYRKK